MTDKKGFPPTILMIRPVRFGYNQQTAVNNAFQSAPDHSELEEHIQAAALKEFDHFVKQLQEVGIPLLIIQDTDHPHTPDSIFPNNWMTTHADGRVVLFPMFAENRRLERKDSVIRTVEEQFKTENLIDLSVYESENRFLEGTGSFILDREHRIAYACLSPRTDEQLFRTFCAQLNFQPIVFRANDTRGIPIYHTNVMMCVADQYAVINLQSIDSKDRENVARTLKKSGKTVIEITQDQMDAFAGNMLQLFNKELQPYLVMSTQAYHSLNHEQIKLLESFNPILHVPIDTIERHGGGSARCMMAELFLSPK